MTQSLSDKRTAAWLRGEDVSTNDKWDVDDEVLEDEEPTDEV